MSKAVVAEVIALIELGMIAQEDIVKCLKKANSEPDTWAGVDFDIKTESPKRKWVGLTDEEVKKIAYNNIEIKVARAIEAKLKEKNT